MCGLRGILLYIEFHSRARRSIKPTHASMVFSPLTQIQSHRCTFFSPQLPRVLSPSLHWLEGNSVSVLNIARYSILCLTENFALGFSNRQQRTTIERYFL